MQIICPYELENNTVTFIEYFEHFISIGTLSARYEALANFYWRLGYYPIYYGTYYTKYQFCFHGINCILNYLYLLPIFAFIDQKRSKNKHKQANHFRSIFENNGKQYKIEIGDGNCFYRCLADEIYDNCELHWQCRAEIWDYIEQHPNYYNQILVNQTFESFVAHGRRNGTYADNEAVSAACEVYQVNIIVYELTPDMEATRVAFDLQMENVSGFESWQFGENPNDRALAFANVPIIEVTRHDFHYNLVPHSRARNLIENKKNPKLNIAALKRDLFELNDVRFNPHLRHFNNNKNANASTDAKSDDRDYTSEPPKKRRKTSSKHNNNEANFSKPSLFDDDLASFEAALDKIMPLDDDNGSKSMLIEATDKSLSNNNATSANTYEIDDSNQIGNTFGTNDDFSELPNQFPSLKRPVGQSCVEIYSLPGSEVSNTRFNRPNPIGYKVISNGATKSRYRYYNIFKLYMIARYLEVPRVSNFKIIEEEFSAAYPERRLSVQQKRSLNKRVKEWVKDEDTIRLLALTNPWGCRKGGGGSDSKFDSNTKLAVYKICYENALNGVLMCNADIQQTLTNMAELHLTIDPLPTATRADAKTFRFVYQVNATHKGKTFYDPAAVLEAQIPSLIIIGVAQTLLPITYVVCPSSHLYMYLYVFVF